MSTATSGNRQEPLWIRWTLLRPVRALVLFATLIVVGSVALPRIPLQLVPNGLTAASCFVYIPVPDATPREVMERIAKPCEDRLRTLSGMKKVTTTSSATSCRIRIAFSPQRDPGVMVAEIRDRLEKARPDWIEGVDRYFLWRHSGSDMPVYICALSMDVDEEKVDVDYLFENVVKKRLAAVEGVARVDVWGLLDKQVEIGIDPDKVDSHGTNLYGLIERLGKDQRAFDLGRVRVGEQERFVRLDGRFMDFEEIEGYPVDRRYRIRDLASVGFAHSVKDRLARANGFHSRSVVVHKEAGANSSDVCAAVESELQRLQSEFQQSVPTLHEVSLHTWLNQGDLIEYSINSLSQSGLWGGLCAIVVLYVFFRRVGMTILVAGAIPTSLMVTVIWIFFCDGSFNLMSLMGLSLGIGMLVDNSIVVVENIVRKAESGLEPRRAAACGIGEVALAVTLATLTTVMVFVPILFIENPHFRIIAAEIGEPVCVSVLASLAVALVLIPQGVLLASRRSGALGICTTRGVIGTRINAYFVTLARYVLAHRIETTLVLVGLVASTALLYRQLPRKGMNDGGPRRFEVHADLPRNSSLADADRTIATIESAILERKEELKLRAVTCWFRSTGGTFNLFLRHNERHEEEDFYARLKPMLPRIAGVQYRFGFEDFADRKSMTRVQVFVHGTDLGEVERLAERVRLDLSDRRLFPQLRDVTRWREDERGEVVVRAKRRLAQEHGVDSAAVARMVSWALRGASIPDYHDTDREYPFWIRYGASVKDDLTDLNAVRVFRPDGSFVRLTSVAAYHVTPGLGEVHRVNGKMTIGFSVGVEGSLEQAREAVAAHFRDFPAVPQSAEISLENDTRAFDSDMESVGTALFLAFSLVFVVMGVLFESFLLPLSVLCIIPFAVFGSFALLWIIGMPLDIVGMIGLLILVGLVVNNAIVLIDRVNRARWEGVSRHEAILIGVRERFRPIWMTALTTLAGLLPMLLLPQRGEGIDYKPLATVLIGGLVTSTPMTLLVVPLFYSLFDDLSTGMRSVVATGVQRRT